MEDSGFEIIDLGAIKLKEITPEGYKLRETPWDDDRKIAEGEGYFRIEDPVREEDYERLLWDLGNTPGLRSVDVRFGTEWLNRFPSMLAQPAERRLTALVAQNEPIKRNFLEAHFKSNSGVFLATIGFGELGGELIGYKMRISSAARDMFGLEGEFRYYNAIWVPPAFEAAVRKQEPKFAELYTPLS